MTKTFTPKTAAAVKTNIAPVGIRKEENCSSFLLRRAARRERRAYRAI